MFKTITQPMMNIHFTPSKAQQHWGSDCGSNVKKQTIETRVAKLSPLDKTNTLLSGTHCRCGYLHRVCRRLGLWTFSHRCGRGSWGPSPSLGSHWHWMDSEGRERDRLQWCSHWQFVHTSQDRSISIPLWVAMVKTQWITKYDKTTANKTKQKYRHSEKESLRRDWNRSGTFDCDKNILPTCSK